MCSLQPYSIHQKGAVLIVSLIILLMLTLIGLSAIQSTSLEEKMAGNYRDQNLSFQAAETTLREGEGWIAKQTSEPVLSSASCTSDCTVWDKDALFAALSANSYLDNSLWADSRAETATTTIPGVAAAPKYFLELSSIKRDTLNIGQQQDNTYQAFYGVVAEGIGGTANSRTILQSTYTRRF